MRDTPSNPAAMRTPAVASAVVHASVLAVAFLGLPDFLRRPPPVEPEPVMVEFVAIDKKAAAPTIGNPPPQPKEAPIAEEATKAPPPKTADPPPAPPPKPPEVAAVQPPPPPRPVEVAAAQPPPPKPVEPPQPAPPKPVEDLVVLKPKEPEPPKVEKVPEPPKVEKVPEPPKVEKPPEPPKVEKVPEPPKPPPEVKKPDPPKPPPPPPPPRPPTQRSVDSMVDDILKNQQSTSKVQTPESQAKPPPQITRQAPAAPQLAAVVTASEVEGVRQKIRPCWNFPAGVRDQNALIVTLIVQMNQNGTPVKADLRDAGRYNNDPTYRAAADAAHRAIMNPRCQPWPLAAEKYANWRTITFNFDPRDY